MTTRIRTNKKYFTICMTALIFFATGCVSSMLKEPAPKFSSNAILPDLSSAFEKNKESSFPAWKHKDTGAMLSVFSDCENPESSLNEAHRLISDSVENVKLQKESRENIGDKRVFLKNFSGEIEADPIEIWTAAFRNDGCIYVSSLSGRPEKPEMIKAQWFQFIEKIKFK